MTTVDKSTKKYSTFDPRYISDCILWIDGADSSSMSLSGSNITSITDKSKSAYSITPVIGNTATLVSAGLNGRSYIQLGLNRLTISSFVWRTNFTIFCVVRVNNAQFLYSQQVASTYYNYIFTGNQQLIYVNQVFLALDSINASGTPVISNNTWTLVSLGYNNGTTGTNYTINGTSRSTTTGTSTGDTNVTQPLFINGNSSGALGSSWVAEIIHYERNLTSTEREQVEGYLAWKWGSQASLPSGHPYYTTINHGPVLSTFNLTDISGCALWLDGYDPSNNNSRPSNGATVSIWYDKSGNSNNAIQYLTNNLPTYNLTSRGISFSNQMYALTNAISQIGTVFIVGKQIASNGNIMSAKDSSGYAPYYIAIKNDTSVTLTKSDNTLVNFQSLTGTVFNQLTMISGDVTSSNATALLNGGVDTKSSNYTGALKTATQTYIAASWFNGTVSISAASEINEIIVYTTALSTYQRQIIEGYLAWKWGLQSYLPSTHPHKKYYPMKIN